MIPDAGVCTLGVRGAVSNRDALFSFRGGFCKTGLDEEAITDRDRGGCAMAVEGREGSTGKQRRTPFPEDFGERLERLLKMAELSPQELAELLGVTEPTVRRWLRGGVPKGFNYMGIMQLARDVPGGFESDALWRRGIGGRTGEIGARGRATSKRPPPPLSSSPDDALGIRP